LKLFVIRSNELSSRNRVSKVYMEPNQNKTPYMQTYLHCICTIHIRLPRKCSRTLRRGRADSFFSTRFMRRLSTNYSRTPPCSHRSTSRSRAKSSHPRRWRGGGASRSRMLDGGRRVLTLKFAQANLNRPMIVLVSPRKTL